MHARQTPRRGRLRDDGRYQDGGYWATPLAWFMVTVTRRDPDLAARTFCDAVDDFRSRGDVNEWINDGAAGVKDYCASAALPLAGVRRLRMWLARKNLALPPASAARLEDDEKWLHRRALEIIRAGSRPGKDGVRIFTPDASGGYGAFWVRDWSYSLEGCPEAFTRQEVRRGYLFLAAAQRADGCMPDRVRADGTGVYSPGPEQHPLSAHGSTDQSPFMVLVCHQYWTRYHDLDLFRRTAAALEKAMRFTPRNPDTGLVTIPDPALFRPYSFMDSVPLTGDEQFSSVLFWDACRKLAAMFAADARPEKAEIWRREADRVRTGLSTLWDDRTGAFVAASEHWRQPSVWGSVFAVYTGAATPAQCDRIASFCIDHYPLLVKRGQIRHLLKGTFWGRPEPEYLIP